MASILKIDVLQERYANTGILLSGQINGPLGEIITREGRLKLPNEFAANSLNIANALAANTITANLYSGITLNMIENVAATANANQVLTADGTGNFFFADAATELKELTDVNSTATANQVLTADGTGGFYFANTAAGGVSLASFTANSTITAGDLVSLLNNGKIEKTAESSVRSNSVGLTSTFNSSTSDNIYVQYDKTLNKVLVSYASSSACYGVLGTLNADGSITFGTPLQITSQYNLITGAIDPVQNRAVFTFLGNVYVAEISGNNLINLQSPVTFDATAENYNATIYDPNSGKIIIAYSDSANSPTFRAGNIFAATVAGNTITFGQVTVFEPYNTKEFSLSIDNDTNKVIVGYSLIGGAAKCVIATITGTTITTSTPATASPGTADFVKVTYASNGIVVAAFRDYTNSNYGAYTIGQISGNSVTFGSPVIFNSATSLPIGLSYDDVSGRIAISYADYGNNTYGTIKSGIIENGAITFEATDIFNNNSTYEVFSITDSTYNRILIGYKNGASGPGRITTYSTYGAVYKDNVNDYIGIAKDSIVANQDGSVFIIGDIADNQINLTENQIYYVDQTGNLTTSKTEYGIVGRAISSTSIQLLDDKPTTLTDLNIVDGTTNQVLTTDGAGSFYFAAASDPITVQKTNTTNAILSTVTNVNDFRFDEDSGFDIVDLGSGAVKIQMNSTFKTWKVDGQDDLVATGLDTIELVAGDGITLTTNANGSPYKTITFTGANTLTDLNIADGTANQVLTADGSGNFFFANNDAEGASTLTDLGIADGEADQVLTTDGNGSFFFGHTLSVLNQDLISGGEITQLRDCRTVIDLGTVDTRLGYASPEGSKTVLLANDSTIVSSSSVSIISEENSIVKLNNIHLLSDVNFDAIANNSISGNKIYGGLLSADTANIGNNAFVVDNAGNVRIGTGTSVTGGRYLDIYNTGSSPTDFSILRLITQQVGSSSTTSLDIYKRKNGQFTIANNDTDSAAYTSFHVGASERMRIDSSGRVTTPYQPHIFGTPGLGTVGANGKADRFSVSTSRGNLTASSGVITVPVDGVYAITFTTITEYAENVRKDNWIYVNNVVIASGLNEVDTTGYKHRSLAISIFIYEGDYIEFGITSWYATGNVFDPWQTASVTLLG